MKLATNTIAVACDDDEIWAGKQRDLIFSRDSGKILKSGRIFGEA